MIDDDSRLSTCSTRVGILLGLTTWAPLQCYPRNRICRSTTAHLKIQVVPPGARFPSHALKRLAAYMCYLVHVTEHTVQQNVFSYSGDQIYEGKHNMIIIISCKYITFHLFIFGKVISLCIFVFLDLFSYFLAART